MTSVVQTIFTVNYILTVYIGYFNVITGLIGNSINILVFTQLRLFRGNQSAFYLTVASIVDCFQLIFGTATRVTTTAFGYDPTRTSPVWCKLRVYFTQFGVITSSAIVCFAAIDQYLSTHYSPRLRQLSTFKIAQHLISGLIIFALLDGIPVIIFYEIREKSGCTTFNSIFNYLYSFIQLCMLFGALPIVVSALFSLLAYLNVRRIVRRQISIVRRRLDHQLTAMILVRATLLVITTIPYVIIRIYQIYIRIDPSDMLALAVNLLINIAIIVVYTLDYSSAFYLFWATSTRFRRQVKYLFYKKIWRKFVWTRLNRNRIAPDNQQQTAECHRSNVKPN